MTQKKVNLSKSYINLNQKNSRSASCTYIRQPNGLRKKKKCIFSLLSLTEFESIFKFLSLLELIKLFEALEVSSKLKDQSKSLISYLIITDRLFINQQYRQSILYKIFKNKKLSKYRMAVMVSEQKDKESINMDVDRTYVQFCRNIHQVSHMKTYMKRVLYSLSTEFSRIGYTQGFHYLIKSMYQNQFAEQESFMLASYILKDMKVEKLYEKNMVRIQELCYVLEVYLFNNLPQIHHFLKSVDVSADIFATSWFITLFSEHLSLHMLNKLWILFLMKGWKMFIKFGISVLCAYQNEILQKNQGNIHAFLRDILLNISTDKQKLIWRIMPSIKVTNRMIDYLANSMKSLQRDTQLCLWQLKFNRKQQQQTYESTATFDSNYITQGNSGFGICCQKFPPSTQNSFPYCNSGG